MMQQLEVFLQKQTRPNQRCVVLSMNICLGSFILGYEFSVYSPCQASVSLANNWFNNPDEHFIHGVLNAALPFGVMFGILISTFIHPFTIRYVFISNDFVSISAILLLIQNNFNHIFIGRFILGVTQGINSVFIPIYIEQMSNHQVKGLCGSLNTCFYQGGFLFSFFMGYLLPTKAELEKGRSTNMYLLVFTWPILLCLMRLFNLLSFFSFDTPQDYVNRGQFYKAQRILELLQNNKEHTAQHLFHLSTHSPEHSSLSLTHHSPQLLLAIFYGALQPFSGINAIIFYCQQVFQQKSETYANLMTLCVGVMLVCSALVSGQLVDRLGRKRVTLWGLLGCTVCLALLALQIGSTIVAIYSFVLSYGMSIGPVFSIYISEILPLQGVWVAIFFNWFFYMLVGLFFPKAHHLYGPTKVYSLFCLSNFIGFIIIYYAMIETKDKTEEQIQSQFNRKLHLKEYTQLPNKDYKQQTSKED